VIKIRATRLNNFLSQHRYATNENVTYLGLLGSIFLSRPLKADSFGRLKSFGCTFAALAKRLCKIIQGGEAFQVSRRVVQLFPRLSQGFRDGKSFPTQHGARPIIKIAFCLFLFSDGRLLKMQEVNFTGAPFQLPLSILVLGFEYPKYNYSCRKSRQKPNIIFWIYIFLQ